MTTLWLFRSQDTKQCPLCETIKSFDEFSVSRTAADGRQGYCQTCNQAYQRQRLAGSKSDGVCAGCRQRPIEAPDHRCLVCFFKKAASRSKLGVDRWRELEDLWRQQDGICAYTRVPMRLETGPVTWDSASVEHIDRTKPKHDITNICWVIWQANCAKNKFPYERLVATCRLIVDFADARLRAMPAANDTEVPWNLTG